MYLERGSHMYKKIPTWSGKSSFSYSGSILQGTEIAYGNNQKAYVSAEQYAGLLRKFKGQAVNVGTSRTVPPAGSVGEWLMENVTRTAIASYVGPILLEEGYAEKLGGPDIRFFI